MTAVRSPVPTFTGVVAGVSFEDGQADTDDPAALAYFRNAGYEIDGVAVVEEITDPIDARDVDDVEVVGTKLRDAAVDPHPEDFLPPTHAGEADPHGPLVVSPGIHGTTPPHLVGGEVSSDPEVQQAKETAAAEEALVGAEPTEDKPARKARAKK